MANDGIRVVLILNQVITGSNILTGITKPNVIGDPNYIAPFVDTGSCPITYNTTCPLMTATADTGSIFFEFSLFNSVVNNPNLTAVKVLAITSSAINGITTFTFPHSPTNYFSGSVGSSMTAGSLYSIALAYMSGSVTFSSCSYTASFNVR